MEEDHGIVVDLVTQDSETLNKLNRQLAAKGVESKPLIGCT